MALLAGGFQRGVQGYFYSDQPTIKCNTATYPAYLRYPHYSGYHFPSATVVCMLRFKV